MMNQPSEEVLRKMIRFLIKTSVPRILEKRMKDKCSHEIKMLEVSQ